MPESCVCLAMVVADNIFREEGSRKVHIAGTFNRISASNFPVRHDSMSLYLAVTNLREGKHKAKLQLNYLEREEKQLLRAEGPVVAKGPLDVAELSFCFRGLVFPKPGTVEIAFYLDDEFVQRRKLLVTQTSEETGKKNA